MQWAIFSHASKFGARFDALWAMGRGRSPMKLCQEVIDSRYGVDSIATRCMSKIKSWHRESGLKFVGL